MARSGQDVIGFTRIFVLFCALVLAPALFLSSFGVIAIINERQAERQRRVDAASLVLRQALGTVGELIETTDRAALAALEASDPAGQMTRATAEGLPIRSWVLLDAEGAPLDGTSRMVGDALVLTHIARLSRRAEPARPSHAAVDEGSFSGVVSLQRSVDGRALVYELDPARLDAAVEARIQGDVAARVRTADGGNEPVQHAVERVLELANADSSAKNRDGTRDELGASRLAPPFDRFTVVAEWRGGQSHFIVIAYIVMLVVFLATLITGVVITARLIYQETRLSRLKTDFVSHMSHELRTPLTSIRMFIDTLRLGRADSPEEEQECLELLAKETERLSEMIERVLGYARLKAGRRLFNPVDVRVQDIVDEAVLAFRAQTLAGEDVTLRTDVDAALPVLHADREALVEALLNLVSNAYKYTGPNKEITVFARSGRRGRVLLGVKDNGPGLTKAEQRRVFERFYQARNLLSSPQPGSGLGLAITKAIVEGNGGRVSVESEPGRGATFIIDMPPLTQAQAQAQAQAHAQAQAQTPTQAQTHAPGGR